MIWRRAFWVGGVGTLVDADGVTLGDLIPCFRSDFAIRVGASVFTKVYLMFDMFGNNIGQNGHFSDTVVATGCLVFTCRVMLRCRLFSLRIAYADIECLALHRFSVFGLW